MSRSFVSFVVATQLFATAFAQVALDGVEVAPGVPDPVGRFGSSVALDGDRLLVGAPESSATQPAAGRAEIFERDASGAWLSVDVLAPPFAQSLARFGRVVALDGDDALISYGTVARVEHFERDVNGDWILAQTLFPPLGDLVNFGRAVAISGDRVAVVSTGSNFLGQGPGAVSIFERTGGGPFVHVSTAFTTLTSQSPAFGASIALDGDRVAVGHPRVTVGGFGGDAGAVQIFDRGAGGTWSAGQVVTAQQPVFAQYFGTSCALDGLVLCVGRPGSALTEGRVEVFTDGGSGTFAHQSTLGAGSAAVADSFGNAVALEGSLLAVGSPLDDDNGAEAGIVHLFERTTSGDWYERTRFGHSTPAPADNLSLEAFGLALDDGRIAAGAPRRNALEGAAFVFDVESLQRGLARLSLSSGGTQHLLLRAGEARGGDAFIVLGSITGTSPAIPLAPGVDLPLVFDAYTNLGLSFSTPVQPSLGVLDAFGRADTGFHVPVGANPSFAGAVFFHAYVTIDLVNFDVGASNAVSVVIVP